MLLLSVVLKQQNSMWYYVATKVTLNSIFFPETMNFNDLIHFIVNIL